MICCISYILHLRDCIFLIHSCIGVMRQMHVKYSEQRRQGSGDEPATLSLSCTLPYTLSISLWRAVFLESAHFYESWLKIHRGSARNLMFAGLLQHSARNNVLCSVATAAEYHFVCTVQTNGAVLVILELMCLSPREHEADSNRIIMSMNRKEQNTEEESNRQIVYGFILGACTLHLWRQIHSVTGWWLLSLFESPLLFISFCAAAPWSKSYLGGTPT